MCLDWFFHKLWAIFSIVLHPFEQEVEVFNAFTGPTFGLGWFLVI
jgi:hypothetical protein